MSMTSNKPCVRFTRFPEREIDALILSGSDALLTPADVGADLPGQASRDLIWWIVAPDQRASFCQACWQRVIKKPPGKHRALFFAPRVICKPHFCTTYPLGPWKSRAIISRVLCTDDRRQKASNT
jgi:hypothetical protein